MQGPDSAGSYPSSVLSHGFFLALLTLDSQTATDPSTEGKDASNPQKVDSSVSPTLLRSYCSTFAWFNQIRRLSFGSAMASAARSEEVSSHQVTKPERLICAALCCARAQDYSELPDLDLLNASTASSEIIAPAKKPATGAVAHGSVKDLDSDKKATTRLACGLFVLA
jgi:hypothetical protein